MSYVKVLFPSEEKIDYTSQCLLLFVIVAFTKAFLNFIWNTQQEVLINLQLSSLETL